MRDLLLLADEILADDWLTTAAAKAERRLRAIPVEDRSPTVRRLVGPHPSPCEHCGGTGTVWTGALGPEDGGA